MVKSVRFVFMFNLAHVHVRATIRVCGKACMHAILYCAFYTRQLRACMSSFGSQCFASYSIPNSKSKLVVSCILLLSPPPQPFMMLSLL